MVWMKGRSQSHGMLPIGSPVRYMCAIGRLSVVLASFLLPVLMYPALVLLCIPVGMVLRVLLYMCITRSPIRASQANELGNKVSSSMADDVNAYLDYLGQQLHAPWAMGAYLLGFIIVMFGARSISSFVAQSIVSRSYRRISESARLSHSKRALPSWTFHIRRQVKQLSAFTTIALVANVVDSSFQALPIIMEENVAFHVWLLLVCVPTWCILDCWRDTVRLAAIRLAKDLCACGYPLEGAKRCPECGRPRHEARQPAAHEESITATGHS